MACWIIAGVIIFTLRKDFRRLTRVRISYCLWLLAGAVAGVVLLVLASVAMIPFIQKLPALILDYTVLLRYPYMLGYAGIDEKFVFRGLLWGVLRRAGWREIWIWLFQAALFVLVYGNVWHLETALRNLLIIFAGGLVFGALAWRSRSVASTIFADTFYNFSGFFGVIVIQWLGL